MIDDNESISKAYDRKRDNCKPQYDGEIYSQVLMDIHMKLLGKEYSLYAALLKLFFHCHEREFSDSSSKYNTVTCAFDIFFILFFLYLFTLFVMAMFFVCLFFCPFLIYLKK